MLGSCHLNLKPTAKNTANDECVSPVGDSAHSASDESGLILAWPDTCTKKRTAARALGCWPAVAFADTPPRRAPIIVKLRSYCEENSALSLHREEMQPR